MKCRTIEKYFSKLIERNDKEYIRIKLTRCPNYLKLLTGYEKKSRFIFGDYRYLINIQGKNLVIDRKTLSTEASLSMYIRKKMLYLLKNGK